MSMSEFEKQLHIWGDTSSSFSTQGQQLPDDFSEEDMAFSQELDMLFAPNEEELPPFFVQTLLQPEDPRFEPVATNFEYKTRARVFRRLKLRHRLFSPARPSLPTIVKAMPAQRSLLTVSVALMLVMLITILLTGPSFASGIEILLQGTRTGVMQVPNYPNGLSPIHHKGHSDTNTQEKQLTLLQTQQQLHFPLYWPQALPHNYTLNNLYLYQKPGEDWADGPSFELEFAYSHPGSPPQGTGLLAIREFKLKADVTVLQVVKDGAAHAIKIDQNGRAQAIYVDGQWVLHNKHFPTWVYGQRSELIYQQNGIVFWIVGDQRDGMNKDVLLKTANSLAVFNVSHAIHSGLEGGLNTMIPFDNQDNGPFAGDVLAIFQDDGGDGPYLSVVGSTQPPSPTPKGQLHLH